MPLGLSWPLVAGEAEEGAGLAEAAAELPTWPLGGLSSSEGEEPEGSAVLAGSVGAAAGEAAAAVVGFSWPLTDVDSEPEEEVETGAESEEVHEVADSAAAGGAQAVEEVEFWVSDDVWLYSDEEESDGDDAQAAFYAGEEEEDA